MIDITILLYLHSLKTDLKKWFNLSQFPPSRTYMIYANSFF